MISALLVQIFILVAAAFFLLACIGEKVRYAKALYAAVAVCLIILLLVSMKMTGF